MSDSRAFRKAKAVDAPAPADALRRPTLPAPNGWFCLAFTGELPPGRILTRPLLGEEVVLYRTAGGRPRAIRPHCPHLGAHLGAGGRVQGENLVCPFHRFAFDPDGACVSTGYGAPPPKADIVHHPVAEANGSIYVWTHAQDAPPDWQVPSLYTPGRTTPSHHLFEMAGHPQDFVENAFDFGHFTQLHGLTDFTIEGEPVPGEKTCVLRLSARRPTPVLRRLRLDYTLTVIGLATFLIEVPLPGADTTMHIVIHFTPIRPGRAHVRVATAVELGRLPLLGRAGAGRTARPLNKLLTVLAQRWTCRDVARDFPVWNHQKHTEQPRLTAADGPIGRYRQWARQFYTEP
ncbi:aromatic ring-hydroxylating oxygenase subunit alpha [Streptomyces vinaceus]|uniref:aromatic ring-hydroxylating oxygenase subunit alpha n=1 Tax=Streptomyces vinaceus TaxID=1960 RepID=UPI00369EC797